jgi:hypothetical protein
MKRRKSALTTSLPKTVKASSTRQSPAVLRRGETTAIISQPLQNAFQTGDHRHVRFCNGADHYRRICRNGKDRSPWALAM